MANWDYTSCTNCKYYEPFNRKFDIFGSVIRTCPKCGNTYIDKRYREVALKPVEFYQKRPMKKWVLRLLIIVSCVLYALTAIYNDEDFTFVLLGLVIASLVAIFAYVLTRRPSYDKIRGIYRDSENRLKDPDYVRLLVKIGKKVPEKYLANAGTDE